MYNEWSEYYYCDDGTYCVVIYDVLDTYDHEDDATMCDWDNPKEVKYIDAFNLIDVEVSKYELIESNKKLVIWLDDAVAYNN